MRSKLSSIGRAVALLALALILAEKGQAQPPKPEVLMRPESLYSSLRDVIDYGVQLYNDKGDYAGCYRLFQGALIAVRPYIAGNQPLLKKVDDSLTSADKLPRMPERAMLLRTSLDAVREAFRPQVKKIETLPDPKKAEEPKKTEEVKINPPPPLKEDVKKAEPKQDVKKADPKAEPIPAPKDDPKKVTAPVGALQLLPRLRGGMILTCAERRIQNAFMRE